MELSVYIESLLQNHDCVIVPNFGGFIANYKSAVIDASKSRIAPPSKSVLFNPNVVNNDGLLSNCIANLAAISYQEANEFIEDKVNLWHKDLAQGGRIDIGEVGFLYKDKEQIVFEQNREFNILLNAYGLTSISFINFSASEAKDEVIPELPIKNVPINTPHEPTEKEAVVIQLNHDKEIILETETLEEEDKIIPIAPRKRRVLKYLGVAAVIPLLFYTYWIPMETDFIDTGKIQISDFNPIHKSPERVYQMRINDFESPNIEESISWDDLTKNLSDNVEIYNYHFDNELYIPIRLDKTATVIPDKEAALITPTEKNNATDLKYHVIGGCFSVESNAENFVIDLKSQGYSAHVLDFNNGLYRVSAGDFADRAEANENLNSFKSDGKSGWVLKK